VALLTEAQRAFAKCGVASSDLKWTGRPPSGILLRRVDTLLVPFSLMWGGFAIFWETMVVRGGAPFVFRLWGIPFVLVGIYFMIGRFFWDAYLRSTTWYGLTTDSALILREGLGGSVQRVYLPAITTIGLELGSDGTGTISFGDSGQSLWQSRRNWSGTPVPSFVGVADAQSVYDLCGASQGHVPVQRA
jgi:hypothetical protein